MNKQLLVTGYGGFVAGSVVQQAGSPWFVTALSRSDVPHGHPDVRHERLDLRDRDRLLEILDDVQPEAVIHAAAVADIDYCQSHQAEAEAVNVGVTQTLAEFCRRSGTRLVVCSTDTVFDGRKGRYTEEDLPHPLNFYGETKVRAEQIVLESGQNMVVVRLSLVVGLPMLGAGNSFLARMIAQFEAGQPNGYAENEIRTPIDIVTLGRALLELAAGPRTGVLHLGGNSRLNRYEMALQIARRLGYSEDLVRAIHSGAMAGRAPRPADASLDNSLARRVLKTPMRSLAEGLDLVFATQ